MSELPRRVLLSAFSCRPGFGSEPGAGWQWALAAAQVGQVWLLTERANEAFIDAALTAEPVPALRPVYVDLPGPWERFSTEDIRIRLRNVAWQLAARRAARSLHEQVGFDVVHHLTFSADWQPVGLPALPGAGFVWGPVGGAAPLPWRLRSWLGRRALAGEFARVAAGSVGRRAFGDAVARRADVVLCQNREVAHRFRRSRGTVLIEPNVALDRQEIDAVPSAVRAPRTAVFAGRLQDWKGLRLAVATVARPELADWRLTVIGEGPARGRAQELAHDLGVTDRIDFVGLLPREVALARIASAAALLMPSMHDACGWVVAEALALGTPPVVLDVGGPPLLVARAGSGQIVPVTADPTQDLAAALLTVAPALPSRAFDAGRVPAVLVRAYEQAGRSR